MLDWMQELLGLPDCFRSTSERGGGVIQGSAARRPSPRSCPHAGEATKGAVNHSAASLATAPRVHLVPGAQQRGEGSARRGIGTEQIRIVPHDENFAMRPDELARMIAADLADGLVPFFVCSSHGTTSSMAFDPTPANGEICARHGIWLHVDAAMSGIAALAPEYRWVNDGPRPGRQLLHQPSQVDGRQLRLRPLLDGGS